MKRIHVAAAVIVDGEGRILIARRPADKHQGGLWEFPGGKCEAGETVRECLQRELHEELGIEVGQARPLIQIAHDYPDKSVLLDVWQVEGFTGEAHGREGQPVRWVYSSALNDFSFPAANRPIVKAAQLPDRYFITPEPDADHAAFLRMFDAVLRKGVQLLQFRAKALATEVYRALAKRVIELAHAHGAKVLLNSEPRLALELGADGVHLTSVRLQALSQRPLPAGMLVAASCHNGQELAQAQKIECDFAVLSPVCVTASHPDAAPLGWQQFAEQTRHAALPVFALGGLTLEDLPQAFSHGAQGVAGIRAFL